MLGMFWLCKLKALFWASITAMAGDWKPRVLSKSLPAAVVDRVLPRLTARVWPAIPTSAEGAHSTKPNRHGNDSFALRALATICAVHTLDFLRCNSSGKNRWQGVPTGEAGSNATGHQKHQRHFKRFHCEEHELGRSASSVKPGIAFWSWRSQWSNDGPWGQGTTRPLHFPGQPSVVSSRTLIWHGKLNTGLNRPLKAFYGKQKWSNMIKSEVSEVMGPWGYPQILHIFGFSKKKTFKKNNPANGVPPPQCRPKVHRPSVWANIPSCRAACHLERFWGETQWLNLENWSLYTPLWFVRTSP